MHHYFQPVQWSRAAGVPLTCVVNQLDRAVPVDLQEAMLARLPTAPDVVRLVASHIPAVTDPDAFASVVQTVRRQ